MKIDLPTLSEKLLDARVKLPVGEFFRHRKSGDIYSIAMHSLDHDGHVMINYVPVRAPGTSYAAIDASDTFGGRSINVIFVQPMRRFTETVEYRCRVTGKNLIGTRFCRVTFYEGEYWERLPWEDDDIKIGGSA